MSSGTGAEITPQDANDLLQKLITESTKVQAVFASGANVTAAVKGRLRVAPDGTFSVAERTEPGTSVIMFDPSQASSRRYGDTRAFPVGAGLPKVASAIVFVFRDGSQLSLFEIAG